MPKTSHSEKPNVERPAILTYAVSNYLNNIHTHLPQGIMRTRVEPFLREKGDERVLKLAELHKEMDETGRELGLDLEAISRETNSDGRRFGIRWGEPTQATAAHARLWPLFVAMLRHVDDPRELTR